MNSFDYFTVGMEYILSTRWKKNSPCPRSAAHSIQPAVGGLLQKGSCR